MTPKGPDSGPFGAQGATNPRPPIAPTRRLAQIEGTICPIHTRVGGQGSEDTVATSTNSPPVAQVGITNPEATRNPTPPTLAST